MDLSKKSFDNAKKDDIDRGFEFMFDIEIYINVIVKVYQNCKPFSYNEKNF